MDELKARLAANEATMGAVQETLHRVDRMLDKIGANTEGIATVVAVQNTRADGQDLRMLSFKESFEGHLKDDVTAFRRIDDKFETLKQYVRDEFTDQTSTLVRRMDSLEFNVAALGSWRAKMQGASWIAVTLIGWAVILFGHFFK